MIDMGWSLSCRAGRLGVWRVLGRTVLALCALAANGARATGTPGAAPEAAPAVSLPAALPDARFDAGTFWQVSTAQGAISHVLGTIHVGDPDALRVPRQALQQLRSARQIVVELAADRIDPDAMDQLQRLPPGESLVRLLGSRDAAVLRARLARAGLALGEPQRYRPWVLSQLLQTAGALPIESLDDRIVRQARHAGIEVLSLETLQEQLGAFDCIDLPGELAVLKDTLAMPEDFFDTLNRELLALYRTQHIGRLLALAEQRFPVTEAALHAEARTMQCAVADRNQRFAQRLPALLSLGGAFVAIGAAHLVGPQGVLARLAAAGFNLTRVGSDDAEPEAASMPEASR